jgi:hypothetical protein
MSESEQNPGLRIGGEVAARMHRVHEASVRIPATLEMEPETEPTTDETVVTEAEPVSQPIPDVPEIMEPREHLTWEHVHDQFSDIILELDKAEVDRDAQGHHEIAHREYVEREGDPILKRFGKLVLMAARMDGIEKEAQALRSLRPSQRHEREKVTVRVAELARYACAYQQMVGAMVADNESAFPPAELASWLSKAAGDPDFGPPKVLGVQGELAGEKLLAGVEGIENLMHGDLDQDLMGQDFVFDPTPAGHAAIDIKIRRHEGVTPVELDRKNHHLILYIDPRHLNKRAYEVQPQFVDGYRAALTHVLVNGGSLIPEEADQVKS